MSLPKLVVFDLDFTLWDCGGTWCDCLAPPFRKEHDIVLDRNGRQVTMYRDVSAILQFCDQNRITMALASRTEQPSWARELLDLLDVTNRFAYSEIYPSSKRKHFTALRKATNTEFDAMLFFDDEMRNIKEVSRLGVSCVYVEDGISMPLFRKGISDHANEAPEPGSFS